MVIIHLLTGMILQVGRGDVPFSETNISFYQGTFEHDFPFPKVGYVSFLEVLSH